VALANPSEDVVLLALAVGRDEDPDRLPDQFARLITKQSLRGGVARLDDAVQILCDDRIV
jgi:hypothetical protein